MIQSFQPVRCAWGKMTYCCLISSEWGDDPIHFTIFIFTGDSQKTLRLAQIKHRIFEMMGVANVEAYPNSA